MRRMRVVLLLILTGVFCLATGAFAASNLKEIKAFLNGDVKFVMDGASWRPIDDKGNEVLPITYNGTTYLPLRVLAGAFDIPIKYDGPTKTITIGEGENVLLYAQQVKVEYSASDYFDVIDKDQLVFGGHQYDGAFAVAASPSERYYAKFDFGQSYQTMHLMIVGKANLKLKVYNGSNQPLTEEIDIVEGEVTEVDIDLQGSQYAMIYTYGADSDLSEYPLVYILKDSYVK